jgi:hypothetical protein
MFFTVLSVTGSWVEVLNKHHRLNPMFNHSKIAGADAAEVMTIRRPLSRLVLNHDPETEAMISEALKALKPE